MVQNLPNSTHFLTYGISGLCELIHQFGLYADLFEQGILAGLV
jgi:hypothetical protein